MHASLTCLVCVGASIPLKYFSPTCYTVTVAVLISFRVLNSHKISWSIAMQKKYGLAIEASLLIGAGAYRRFISKK